jgi:hypothetical protein
MFYESNARTEISSRKSPVTPIKQFMTEHVVEAVIECRNRPIKLIP